MIKASCDLKDKSKNIKQSQPQNSSQALHEEGKKNMKKWRSMDEPN